MVTVAAGIHIIRISWMFAERLSDINNKNRMFILYEALVIIHLCDSPFAATVKIFPQFIF